MISERIKLLRKDLGLSQTEFGERLGLTRNAVNNVENERAEASELLIRSVVHVFGVSETWLRTGDGEMYVPRTRLEEITGRIAELSGGTPNPFREKLLLALLRIPDDKWPLIEQAAREILAEDPGVDDPMETEEPPETEKGQEP